MTGPRRVIVNADDYGLTSGVNRAVVAAHSHGVLTSTTVLVNTPRAAEAEAAAANWPELGFGLHVNFSRGEPSTDPARVRTLIGDDGRFLEPRQLVRRLMSRAVDPSEVYLEVRSQIAAFRRLGIEPSHWDAHQSVAFLPGLRGPTTRAAGDLGVLRARTPRVWIVEPGCSPSTARIRWRLRRARRLLTDTNRLVAHVAIGRAFKRPDWLVSPNLVAQGDYSTRWRVAFESLPPGTSEVVSHPAYVDDELAAAEPGLVEERGIDLESLLDPGARRALERQHAILVNFRAL